MHRTAYLALVIATMCWGANAVAGKLAIGHISPMMLTFLRWLLAVIIMFSISLPHIRKDWPVVRSNIPILIFYGAVGFVVFNAAVYTAVKYTTAINAALEHALIPVLIFVLNFVLFRTKVSWAQVLGFTITFIGVLTTAVHGDFATLTSMAVNVGDAIMMIAVVAYAVYTIGLRWRPPINWRTMMAMTALVATIASVPLVLWEYSAGQLILPDATGWIIVVLIAIFASLVAQILYIVGVQNIGANRAGLFINLIPVFGMLFSATFIGEQLQFFHIVALVMALGGIAIAEWGKPASQPPITASK